MSWWKWLILIVFISPVVYYIAKYYNIFSSDDLEVVLKEMSFIPLHPPSTAVHLGSLYRVDTNGNHLLECLADAEVLTNVAKELRTDKLVSEDMAANASLSKIATGIFRAEEEIAGKIKIALGSDFKKKVVLTLSNVKLLQIPGDADAAIQDALMSQPSCDKHVKDVISLGFSVCQEQMAIQADAFYSVEKSDTDESGATTPSKPNNGEDNGYVEQNKENDEKTALRQAIRAATQSEVSEINGKITTTKALYLGIRLDPVCVTPPGSKFISTWSESSVDRLLNVLLYEYLLPIVKPKNGIQVAG